VETREQLQQSYQDNEQQYSSMLRKADRAFLKKVEELVLGKEHNTDYSIEKLCNDMGMSRTQLHNKLKALTGLSTSIFVRVLRLNRAKQLLETTQESVSEIAYRVGFNDPSYFTRCFTDEFGKPPKALKQKL
jgi:AraC-like DNA-binding protein